MAFFNTVNPFPEKVFAPKCYETYSSRRLLVMEWIDGVPPEDTDLPLETRKKIAIAGGESIFHQIVIQGFFHGDPHTGNLLVTPDEKLCLLDWGLAGHLTRSMRYFLSDLFAALASKNPEKVVQVMIANAIGRVRIDPIKLEKQISFVLLKHPGFPSHNLSIGPIMIDLLYEFGSNGLHLAKDYSLLAKAVMAIEESAKTLDPNFDIRAVSKKFLEKLEWERWNPQNVIKQAYWLIKTSFANLREMPATLQRLLGRLEDNNLTIRIEHVGIEETRKAFNTAVNRLVLAIIIGSLLIGSSMVVTTMKTSIWQFPAVLGIFGYQIACIFTLWLIWDILRYGRHK